MAVQLFIINPNLFGRPMTYIHIKRKRAGSDNYGTNAMLCVCPAHTQTALLDITEVLERANQSSLPRHHFGPHRVCSNDHIKAVHLEAF